jgi:hypothetical protein
MPESGEKIPSENGVETYCREYAAPFDNSEIGAGNGSGADGTGEHECERDCRPYGKRCVFAVTVAAYHDEYERHHAENDDKGGNDVHMHDVVECSRKSCRRQRKQRISDRAYPLHIGKRVYAVADCSGKLASDVYADHHDGDERADTVQRGKTLPQQKRRSVGSAQVADCLAYPVVSGIVERRKENGEGVGDKAHYSEKSEIINTCSFPVVLFHTVSIRCFSVR